MPWWGFIALLFLLSANSVLAAFSFSLSSLSQNSLSNTDQVLDVTLNIADLPSPSYFRVAFQKDSGEPYFGQIQNNSGSWVSIKSLSSDCHDYFLVNDTNAGLVVIKLRLGDDVQVENGSYQIKAHRFTSSACSTTPAQNTLNINIGLSQDMPTPTIISSPLPTSSPIPTPKTIPHTSKPEVTPAVLSLNLGDTNIPTSFINIPSPNQSPLPTVPSVSQLVSTSKPNKFPAILTISLGVISIITSCAKLCTFKDRLV